MVTTPTPFERRMVVIEQLAKAARPPPAPPPHPGLFVLWTVAAFHCPAIGRRQDEHPMNAVGRYLETGKTGDDLHAEIGALLQAHGIPLTAPDAAALDRMQKLLDDVPERWRDLNVAWWPRSAIELWMRPETISRDDAGAAVRPPGRPYVVAARAPDVLGYHGSREAFGKCDCGACRPRTPEGEPIPIIHGGTAFAQATRCDCPECERARGLT